MQINQNALQDGYSIDIDVIMRNFSLFYKLCRNWYQFVVVQHLVLASTNFDIVLM